MDFPQPSSALKRKQIARIIVPHAHIVRDFDAFTNSFLQRRQQRRGIEILRFGVWMKTVDFAFLMAESQASFCGTLTHSWLGAPQGRRLTRAMGKRACGLRGKIGLISSLASHSGAVPMQSSFVAKSRASKWADVR
jgi:hypothetical protein